MANLTQKMISEVFFQLLKKKNLDKITVKEIVDRCDINRNTFYYHYSDIFDLFDSLICSSFTDAAARLSSADTREGCITDIADFLTENKTALKNACYSSAYPLLYDRLSTFFDSLFTSLIRLESEGCEQPEKDVAFAVRFLRCAAIGLLKDWLDGDEASPLEIFKQLETHIVDVMRAMLPHKN